MQSWVVGSQGATLKSMEKRTRRSGKTQKVVLWPDRQRARRVAMMRELSTRREQEEKRLAGLAAAGLLTPGSGEELEPFEPLPNPGKPLSETLLEDRNDRF